MSDKNDDFVSFENAMRELKLRSEELRKLVSQGDIRAKKEGASMKFKRQDVDALAERITSSSGAGKSAGDALEDDTGMVTEQISDEDTLLSEDVATPAKAARPAPAARVARPAAMAAGPTEKEPGWVTAVAIVSFLVFVWATMVHYSISQEQNPKESMFTSAWSG